jgi:hypothetical protein
MRKAGIHVLSRSQLTTFLLSLRLSKRVYGTGKAFDPDLLNYTSDTIKWNRHVKWGLSVLFISAAQVVLGLWHHYWKARHDANPDARPWKRPLVPSWSHVVLGVVCMLTAYIAMFQGLQLYNYIFYTIVKEDMSIGIIVGNAVVALSGFLFLVSYAIGKLGNMKSGAGQPPANKSVEEGKMEAVKMEDEEEPKEAAVVGAKVGSSATAEEPPPAKRISTSTTGGSEHFA